VDIGLKREAQWGGFSYLTEGCLGEGGGVRGVFRGGEMLALFPHGGGKRGEERWKRKRKNQFQRRILGGAYKGNQNYLLVGEWEVDKCGEGGTSWRLGGGKK